MSTDKRQLYTQEQSDQVQAKLGKPERNKSTIKYMLGGIVTAWVTVGLLCGGYWLFEQYPEVTGGGLVFLMVTGFGALMGWTVKEGDPPVTWL